MTSATNFIGDLFRFRAFFALNPACVGMVLTSALTRHGRCRCSSKERENHLPRFGNTNTLGCRAISSANDRDAAIGMETNELSRDAQSGSLSPGERVRVRASVNLTFQTVNRLTNRSHPDRNEKLVLTTALTPALSPEERENRSPRFGDTDTLGYRAISSANDRDAATAMDTKELSSDVGNCPLSVRERVRVRAGVQTNFR